MNSLSGLVSWWKLDGISKDFQINLSSITLKKIWRTVVDRQQFVGV